MKIHHLGVVVSDLDEALIALGLTHANIVETVFDPQQKNNLHFIYLQENNLWLELVEPRAEDASTMKFAQKFGLGLHHLALGVDDIEFVAREHSNRQNNFILGRYKINIKSFGGPISTLFVAVKGLILEYVQIGK